MAQPKWIWHLALSSIIVILIVHVVSSLGLTKTSGAGQQPTSTGGGTGA